MCVRSQAAEIARQQSLLDQVFNACARLNEHTFHYARVCVCVLDQVGPARSGGSTAVAADYAAEAEAAVCARAREREPYAPFSPPALGTASCSGRG